MSFYTTSDDSEDIFFPSPSSNIFNEVKKIQEQTQNFVCEETLLQCDLSTQLEFSDCQTTQESTPKQQKQKKQKRKDFDYKNYIRNYHNGFKQYLKDNIKDLQELIKFNGINVKSFEKRYIQQKNSTVYNRTSLMKYFFHIETGQQIITGMFSEDSKTQQKINEKQFLRKLFLRFVRTESFQYCFNNKKLRNREKFLELKNQIINYLTQANNQRV